MHWGGVRAWYWGESSRSARRRTQEHRSGAEAGLVSAPMVQHAVEVHGGRPPNYISLIVALETSPLYRAVWESIQIASIPLGIGNINCCSEWGAPRIPAIHVEGGDDWTQGTEIPNPRPAWSKETMTRIKDGQVKRVKYWREEEPKEDLDHDMHKVQRPNKRARVSGEDPGEGTGTQEPTRRVPRNVARAKEMPPSIARAVEKFRRQQEDKLHRDTARMEPGPGGDDGEEAGAAVRGQARDQSPLETATNSAGRLIVAADGAVTEVTAPEAAQPLPAPMGAADMSTEVGAVSLVVGLLVETADSSVEFTAATNRADRPTSDAGGAVTEVTAPQATRPLTALMGAAGNPTEDEAVNPGVLSLDSEPIVRDRLEVHEKTEDPGPEQLDRWTDLDLDQESTQGEKREGMSGGATPVGHMDLAIVNMTGDVNPSDLGGTREPPSVCMDPEDQDLGLEGPSPVGQDQGPRFAATDI